jgi:hypothetical protein
LLPAPGLFTRKGDGRVVWEIVRPRAKPGFQSATLYQHESTLRFILKSLGRNRLPGHAANAPDMNDFLN